MVEEAAENSDSFLHYYMGDFWLSFGDWSYPVADQRSGPSHRLGNDGDYFADLHDC